MPYLLKTYLGKLIKIATGLRRKFINSYMICNAGVEGIGDVHAIRLITKFGTFMWNLTIT